MSERSEITQRSTDENANRNRPAGEPGGCDCHKCGCVFIGEEWHQFCGVCIKEVAHELAEAQHG